MLKIDRYRYNFGGKPVELDNTVEIPQPDSGEFIEFAEEERRREEERRLKEEEERRREEEIQSRVDKVLSQKISEAQARAAKIISNAKAEAKRLEDDSRDAALRMISKANSDSAALMEKAAKDGYKAGYEKGHSEAVKKCESYFEAAAKFLEEINSRKEAYYISNEREILDTIFTASEKIVMDRLRRDDKMIERIIAQAAKSFRNSDFVKISVIDGEVSKEMRTDADFIKGILSYIPEIEVEYLPPEDAPEGTVILDDGNEVVDASVPTQLEFLQEIMRKTHGGEIPPG